MAVYKHTYRGYSGPTRPGWSRWMILPRYTYTRLVQSKFLLLFFAGCLVYPIGCIAFIYLSHNDAFRALVSRGNTSILEVDGRFFYGFCVVQGALAYLLTAFVGPGLVSPDLANGSMPLYLCRPFSRGEYVAGKMSVLLALLSLVTWVPGLLLFAIQGSIAGWSWITGNAWLAAAIFVGLGVWIIVLSLIALAMSAWVKWKIAAGALVLGLWFGGAGFGAAINGILRTQYGSLIDLSRVAHTVWADLLRYDSGSQMSLTAAWTVLGVTCAICLGLLARRVRAFEVVK